MIADYNSYQFSIRERVKYLLQGSVISTILGSIFYKSLIGILILSPIIYIYFKKKRIQLIEERKWKLNQQFRDGILSISAALCAGYSAEHAFAEAYKDLMLIYPEDSLIMKELSYMINQIRMNITVEKVLLELGDRTCIDDIISFAEVFSTAKRTGGDLIKVIKTTSNTISDKIEVKREIVTLITAKRLEANIMKGIPIFIIAYLLYSSPGFLDPLYHNLIGIIAMTILLAGYLAAYLLIDKIVTIDV